jgi:hypothetical protein
MPLLVKSRKARHEQVHALVRSCLRRSRTFGKARLGGAGEWLAFDGLYLPAGAPWAPAFCAELLTFSRGRYDDQVDALGLIGQLLDVMRERQAAPAGPLNAFEAV